MVVSQVIYLQLTEPLKIVLSQCQWVKDSRGACQFQLVCRLKPAAMWGFVYWLSFFPGTQFFLLVPHPGKAPASNSMQFGSQISYSIPEIWISLHITLSDIRLLTMIAQEQYLFTCTSYFKWVCSPFCWVCQDIVEMLQFVQTAVFWKKQKANTVEKLSSHNNPILISFLYLSY